MKEITKVSVDDEVAISFSYASDSQIIIGFSGYFDLETNNYQERSCSLLIEQWTSASLKVDDTNKINYKRKQPLEEGLGIISMVFGLKLTDNLLELYVSTLDNRHLILEFENAVVGYIFP